MKKQKRESMSIVDFVTDPQLLGLSISDPQLVLLSAIYGLPLSKYQKGIFTECTGREGYPRHGFSEATIIAGARAGKDSRIACPIAAYEACFGSHERRLGRGERATIPLIAQDQRATRIAFGYLRSYFTESRLLSSMLDDDPYTNEIRLNNRVTISCFPSTLASLRGWSIPVGVMDEVGFWRLEGSADSDSEIQASIRRGMINFDRTKLIKISSPYMRSGVLYDDFKRHFGQDSPDVLVWRGSSALMNPALVDSKLDEQRRLDPSRFAREYLAEFAEDLESFLPNAWIECAIFPNRHELGPQPGRRYAAGVDASGGGRDAFTLSIVHQEADMLVQDVCRGWRKTRTANVNLEGVVTEIAEILKRYGLREIHGDKYSANWVIEAFRRVGITYRQLDHDKSFYYLEIEPWLAESRIELLDHAELARELQLLERRPRPGGKTIVDHPRGAHDDYANSLAIAAAKAKRANVVQGFPIGVGRVVNPFSSNLADGDGDRPHVGAVVWPTGSRRSDPWGKLP